jgi:hypothetical protein
MLNNPLSQDTNSPWNVYFMNADLKREIERVRYGAMKIGQSSL